MLPTCLLSGPLSLHPIWIGLFRLSPSFMIIFLRESASPSTSGASNAVKEGGRERKRESERKSSHERSINVSGGITLS